MEHRKTALVTGGTDGIGKEVAKGLAKAGYRLILIARNPQKAQRIIGDLKALNPVADVALYEADLTLVADAQRVARAIRADYPAIDVLVQAAGLVPDRVRLTAEGIEQTFAVSYLTRYVLIHELMPTLLASDQKLIVTVAGAGQNGDIHFDDINFTRTKFSPMKVVQQFQQANDALALELAERYGPQGLRVYCLTPGLVATNLHQQWPPLVRFLLTKVAGPLLMVSPEQAAGPALTLIVGNDRPAGVLINQKGRVIKPAARLLDPAYRQQVMALSKQLTEAFYTTP